MASPPRSHESARRVRPESNSRSSSRRAASAQEQRRRDIASDVELDVTAHRSGRRPVRRALVALVLVSASGLVPHADTPLPQFVDITRQAGITFRHTNGASADKHLVETMGSGGLFFDYDNDGWIDIFLVDGGSLADAAVARRARHRLYRNRGNGTFEDVTERSGIQHREYGMGACAGDYDNDGRPDLYITNFGPNALYRNRGDGTFTDVTATARASASRAGARAARLPISIATAISISWSSTTSTPIAAHSPFCGNARVGVRFYCHPLQYDPLPSTVYRNDGGGVFTDVSAASGVGALRAQRPRRRRRRLRRRRLAGRVRRQRHDAELPVPQHRQPAVRGDRARCRRRRRRRRQGARGHGHRCRRLRRRRPAGSGDHQPRFRDAHAVSRPRARPVRLRDRPRAASAFPRCRSSASASPSSTSTTTRSSTSRSPTATSWTTRRSSAPGRPTRSASSCSATRRCAASSRSAATSGPGFAAEKVGRGLAAGDIDNDGDLDLLVTNNGQAAELLRNDGGNRANALLVRLRGAGSNTDAIGARVRLDDGIAHADPRREGGVELSESERSARPLRARQRERADRIEVLWPSGRTETITNVMANETIDIEEGKSVVARRPFAR